MVCRWCSSLPPPPDAYFMCSRSAHAHPPHASRHLPARHIPPSLLRIGATIRLGPGACREACSHATCATSQPARLVWVVTGSTCCIRW
jgi:hypothetical protein